MAMRFPFKIVPVQHPIISLGGRWVRPRPLISVTLIGPAASRLRLGLLDTGGDDTLFPESLAATLGVDLTNAPTGAGRGIGMGNVPLRYAQVGLRITDGREFREWTGWVGFTSAPVYYSILGFAGFLQFFTATFHGDREEVELEVNSFYRGT